MNDRDEGREYTLGDGRPGRERRTMHLTAIVATCDDDPALARLLPVLAAMPDAPDEVIVVDGAASSTTASLCRDHGASWVGARPNRGAQFAQGAARSRGDALWFLHVDVRVHLYAAQRVREALGHGAEGGYFRFVFSGEPTLTKRLLAKCIALRSRVSMVDGEQGIFATRAVYVACSGHSIQPLFEQVQLVRALRRTRRFAALAEPIVIDCRPWERDGYWRRTVGRRLLAAGYACGVPASRLGRWYATFGGTESRTPTRAGSPEARRNRGA